MVKDIVEKIIKIWGEGECEESPIMEDNKHEANLLSLDISKAKNFLGWSPTLDINQCLELTVEWYKSKNRNYNFCVNQIEKFVAIYKSKKGSNL
jgi:CDP-glucose 4,6-dehydratase